MPDAIPACVIDVAYGDPYPSGLPVSIGVPLEPGALSDVGPLTVTAPDGEHRRAGGRVLASWPDGSVRWLLLSFGARMAGPHSFNVAAAASKASTGSNPGPSGLVEVSTSNSRWTIASDRMKVELDQTGPGPLSLLACDGHIYLDDPAKLQFSVDDASSLHEPQRTIRVIEDTPIRARLRVEGAHHRAAGERHLSYRLDVEVWAGSPTVRLDYQFFNLEPGADTQQIQRIALTADWRLDPETHRHFLQKNYGLFYVSRHVFNPDPVALVADLSRHDAHVEDPAMLLDDVDYPFYLHAPLVDTQSWLGTGDGQHAVYLQMHDFTRTKPNRIAGAGPSMSAEFWPHTAGPLDLPQGWSKRQTLVFAFFGPDQQQTQAGTAKLSNAPHQAPTGAAAVLAAPCHEERATVAPAWIAHCCEFEQALVLPVGQHIRIESNIADLVRLDMPETKFDVGDTESHYAGGYAATNDNLVRPLPGAPTIPRRWPSAAPTQTYVDLHEPVWTNNEYDVIHAFANELMRTGRHELMSTLRFTARHNIEVDFLHYNDHQWIHRATPAHSARHTTTGAYPSHFWTQGLLEYYCLTGDPDALEVALALGDKTLEFFADEGQREVLWGFNREVGWTVLALAHLYDITAEQRFRPLLDEIVDYLINFDRNAYTGAVNLSGGNDRLSLNRQVIGSFFGYQSMIDGMDRYATITSRTDVDAWLKQICYDLADAAIESAREGSLPDVRFGLALSVGYERTGDMRFIHMMDLLLDQVFWNGQGLPRGGSVKPVASAYRGWTRMLGHAMRHGLLEQHEFPSARNLPPSDAPPNT